MKSFQTWKKWRQQRRKIRKRWRNKLEESEIKEKVETEVIEGVLFVQHTEGSELANNMRKKLKLFEEINSIRLKIVERAGDKIMDLIHKSNPWEKTPCGRDDCKLCNGMDEKMWGKCKTRCIVYENECITCKEKDVEMKTENRESEDREKRIIENNNKKRKADNGEKDCVNKKIEVYKYIGETSRSAYERLCEHWRKFKDLSTESHILKHYLRCHSNLEPI